MPFRAVADSLYQFRWSFRSLLCRSPRLYLPLVRTRHPLRVHRDTELVFEGFFRSGNTFAFEAFQMAQSHPVAIARHIHAPAQVLFAVRRGIPVLLTVRDPEDCIPSLLLFEPRIALAQALKSYVGYYARLQPVLDDCVVAAFDEVIRDFSAVCRRINHRYNTDFDVFEHTPSNVQACFDRMEALTRSRFGALVEDKTCRPSSSRTRRKISLANAAEHSARIGRLRERARALYHECLRLC